METFSELLAICPGNSSVTGEFPAQRPATRSFDVSFGLRLNKRLSKQSWGWWVGTSSRQLWRHCQAHNNYLVIYLYLVNKLWALLDSREFEDRYYIYAQVINHIYSADNCKQQINISYHFRLINMLLCQNSHYTESASPWAIAGLCNLASITFNTKAPDFIHGIWRAVSPSFLFRFFQTNYLINIPTLP